MSDPDPTHVHPVACESCRAKKCKCDRVLPRCGQCSKSRTRCTYPQSYRRGFPEGYLAGLEQRLLQTEIALFRTLLQQSYNTAQNPSWDLHDEDDDDIVETAFREHAAKQTKTERPREWTDVPLRTCEQRRRWFEMKAEQLQIQSGFSFNYSTQQPNQSLPMSMSARSSSTITTRSGVTTTMPNNDLTSRNSFSSTQWSSPPIIHTHAHTTEPNDQNSGSGLQWISTPPLLPGTQTDAFKHGLAPAAEHPDTTMSPTLAHRMSLSTPPSSSLAPAAAAAAVGTDGNMWHQLRAGTDDNDVDMVAAPAAQLRSSQTPSAGDEGVHLSKAQALSARQAMRFF